MKTLTVIVAVSFLALCVYALELFKCRYKWEDSIYKPFAGCFVSTGKGYIPEKNVRVIEWVYTESEE